MATANALLTVDEFLKLLEHDGERVELVQGEVVTVAAAGFPHERLKARVTRLLNVWLAQNPLGEVFSETMYRLDEHSSLQPDVSVLLNERIRPGIEGLYPERRISPSRSCPRKRPPICRTRSTSTWSMGAGPCGVFYSKPPRILIHRASGLVTNLHGKQILEDPDVLRGLSTPVSAIFEGL